MEQKDKELLLKDLCARLPYGVCAKLPNHHLVEHVYKIEEINMRSGWTTGVLECAGRKKIYSAKIEDCKPYLKPMESITTEEREFLKKMALENTVKCFEEENPKKIFSLTIQRDAEELAYCYKHHYDVFGLIPKDLALSTEVFNPYKD